MSVKNQTLVPLKPLQEFIVADSKQAWSNYWESAVVTSVGCCSSFIPGQNDLSHNGVHVGATGGEWRLKYERAIREIEFTKKRLQQEFDDKLEVEQQNKRQLERRVSPPPPTPPRFKSNFSVLSHIKHVRVRARRSATCRPIARSPRETSSS